LDPVSSLLLGLVQGLTEFLPVSSSGHLVLTERLFGVEAPLAFEVWLHVATLAAVLVALRRDVGTMLRSLDPRARGEETRRARVWILALVAGTVPAAVVGLTAADAVEAAFTSVRLVGVDLLLTALVLFASRFLPPRALPLTPLRGLGIGVAQALAILPGVSRSGMTLVAGLGLGLSGVESARFSFLLAVPAILGAVVLQLPELGALGGESPLALALGFLSAAVSGYGAVRIVWRVMERGRLAAFAPYCLLLGIVVLLWGG
jgi:undecaprenyl-diphosphatase